MDFVVPQTKGMAMASSGWLRGPKISSSCCHFICVDLIILSIQTQLIPLYFKNEKACDPLSRPE